MFTSLSRSRLAGIQSCVVYNEQSRDGMFKAFRDPDFDAEHFCVVTARDSAAPNRKIAPENVQVSVPTLGLKLYAVTTLERIIDQIEADFKHWSPERLPKLVVVSNGNEERSALRHFQLELLDKKRNVAVTLICTPVSSKSNAVNLLHQHALDAGAQIMICIDDDVVASDGAFLRLYEELSDGSPRFVGVRSEPNEKTPSNPVEADIVSMTLAKRRAMGWPAPIGRFNGFPVSVYPTITSFEVYDDVFLSAFFMINDIPQYVLNDITSTYKSSSSLFEFVKRTRRIARSDERILSLVPQEHRDRLNAFAINPKYREAVSAADHAWLQISKSLLSFAENNRMFEPGVWSLDETDLSSKGNHNHNPNPEAEMALVHELARLKSS